MNVFKFKLQLKKGSREDAKKFLFTAEAQRELCGRWEIGDGRWVVGREGEGEGKLGGSMLR